jgi:hypothetical protein
MSVFDEVRANVESAEDPFAVVGGTNWQLWTYEPATGKTLARPSASRVGRFGYLRYADGR